jgi:hypothetical protein
MTTPAMGHPRAPLSSITTQPWTHRFNRAVQYRTPERWRAAECATDLFAQGSIGERRLVKAAEKRAEEVVRLRATRYGATAFA